ncbi:hypothetical protein XCR1_2620020 [Xenorhabdus cabanillasii JM26]|uniref:Uncharacterized protein n=1 Tax=Xenorhabdus cabanillasii JM26 TaxID=1427517 RepID=W1J582_9GAMM|nr:hypothetical protein XCR1_2620020 [Xenorhabdus cabanillasii JM26]
MKKKEKAIPILRWPSCNIDNCLAEQYQYKSNIVSATQVYWLFIWGFGLVKQSSRNQLAGVFKVIETTTKCSRLILLVPRS